MIQTHSRWFNLADSELLSKRANLLDVQQRIFELLGCWYENWSFLGHFEVELVAFVHLKVGMSGGPSSIVVETIL